MEKGQTNNPNGRPKGTPNKITQDMRGFLRDVIDKNRKQMVRDLAVLEPKDRLIILEKLMQYVIPKQSQTKIEETLNGLTDEQVNRVICEITNNIEDVN
ncbi:MAG: hypothetical protein J6Y78_05620 [Paludibacteraceae bacterium]|nr:hypothetical protein [Paludibacteraceae bacterium]MEE3483874.1 hypothetical protein [Bacteroidales bacterium]